MPVLNACGSIGDRIPGLDVETDDHLLKPFRFDEFGEVLLADVARDVAGGGADAVGRRHHDEIEQAQQLADPPRGKSN